MRKLSNLMGLMAAVVCAFLIASCGTSNGGGQGAQSVANQGGTISSDLKIGYVEIDTLLTKYYFSIDLNEAMVKKSENVRLTLNQKAQELERQQQEFQTKYQNNAFLSQERAQQEYERINKLSADLQSLSDKLQSELMSTQEENSRQLTDTISNFLKEFNKTHGFSLIISNTGMDNLLYADDALNITQAVLDGLNSRYNAKK